MKIKSIISVLIISSLCSCKHDKESIVINANEDEVISIRKTLGKYHTDFDNDNCKLQIDDAKNDVRKGKLVYEDNSGSWKIIRYEDEMEEILNEYGIEYKFTGTNCTVRQECYGYYMDSIISERFGKAFIKQIAQRADSLFLSKWETKTYDSWDIDEAPFYKEEDAENYIMERINFPDKWDTISSKFERQYLIVDAFIDYKGKLTNWEIHQYNNLKESNEQFLPEIKKEINLIMKDITEWKAGRLMDKDVNSVIMLDIVLDKEK